MGAAAALFASEPEFAFTDDKENRDASLVEPVDVFAAAAGSLSSSAPFPEFFSLGSFDENLLKKLRADGFSVAAKHQQPVPDDSSSNTQIPRAKSGFCFIGNDRGNRSCIEVSPNDKCMSGDIFPSMDVCVNPRLRV